MGKAKIGFKYDKEGYFVEPIELFNDDIPEYVTIEPWQEPCVKPRFVDGVWTDAGHLPEPLPNELTVTEKLATMERDNRMLRLKNDILANQYQFLEDVITEMIVATLP
ncbi:MAG: hypothetical protein F9K39_14375 [Exiguobacterium chiriqhucha]|uniref:hypothetical protein n=1 Tax=Exiguobacterium chiriqhucha TaxID=1385984 RepID=UPI00144DC3D6|nr:hypothetical protein [Exiguobacterium chiriqhucha]KAB2860964.1 MAG: hypothetical protein F9K39_14375 [Exiguobacterium chiriqhucha]